MENKESFKYTCLFGGGAIRGAAYAGTVKAMEELGINPHTIAGSSVGSVIGGLLAIGYTADELEDIFIKFNFEMFRDVQITLGPKFALSKGELFLDWIRELIEQKFYGKKYKKGTHKAVTFKDIDKDLIIITTDLSSFECKEFSRYETPDFEIAAAIRISCSMPGLMRPIEYNNRTLVDGDLQKSWPMWKLSKHLAPVNERILEFRLEGDFEGNDKNMIEYLNSLYAFTTSMATKFIIDIYGLKDMFDYIVINTGETNIVDFNMPEDKRKELMQIGYDCTINYFKNELPLKKQKLLSMYNLIHDKLVKIHKHLKRKNISKAKSLTSELFIDLCDYKYYIEDRFYTKIKTFKEMFFENIQYPPLFGKTSLNKEENIVDNLSSIIIEFKAKTEELNAYLEEFLVPCTV